MSYLALARKWRPRNFAELVGQEHVRQALVNALDSGRVHHAFLFTGTRGVGKTTIARILARALNCERGVSSSPCGECAACREIDEGRFVDLIEVDAASQDQGRRHARAARERAVPADPRPLQGLPDRRSAHAVDAFLQRAAEDARGAAAAREVPARDHRPAETAGDRPVALPAVQPEAAAGLPDRVAPAADPRGRRRRLRVSGRRPARARRGREPARRALAARPDARLRRGPRDRGRRALDARHRGSPAGAPAGRGTGRPRREGAVRRRSRRSTSSRRTTGSCSTRSPPCCSGSPCARPCPTSATTSPGRPRPWRRSPRACRRRTCSLPTSSRSSAGATSSWRPTRARASR